MREKRWAVEVKDNGPWPWPVYYFHSELAAHSFAGIEALLPSVRRVDVYDRTKIEPREPAVEMLGNEESYFFVGEEGVKLGKIISKDIAEERG